MNSVTHVNGFLLTQQYGELAVFWSPKRRSTHRRDAVHDFWWGRTVVHDFLL